MTPHPQDAGADGITVSEQEIAPYAHDEFATDEFARAPLAVVKPTTADQVREIVALCAKERIPVTAWGPEPVFPQDVYRLRAESYFPLKGSTTCSKWTR